MEDHFELQNRSRSPNTTAKVNRCSSPLSRDSKKLGHRLRFEEPDVSYTDLQSKIVDNVSIIRPRSVECHQKQQADGKKTSNEELVRYMSNLPSFLERGGKNQEKAFNVGVIDWQLLEKWQYFRNIGNNRSPSSSNTSSISSTDGSSSHSRRGHSWSPAYHGMHHPTLQSHLYRPPTNEYYSDFGSAEGNDLKSDDLIAGTSSSLNVQQSLFGREQPSKEKAARWLQDEDCQEKVADLQKSSVTRRLSCPDESKGKMKIQDTELLRRHDKLQASFDYIADQSCRREQDQVELGLPKDAWDSSCSSIFQPSVLTEKKNWGLKKESEPRFSSVDHSMASCTDLSFAVPHSFPHKADAIPSQIEQPCSGICENKKVSAERHHVPIRENTSPRQSRSRKLPEKSSKAAIENLIAVTPSEGSKSKSGSAEASKVRNPSPTRRFSFSIGRLGKVSSSSLSSATPQSCDRNFTVTSGAEAAAESSSTLNISKANHKGRSSPLRRLLGPLLKPKVENSDHCVPASMNDSTSSNKACKSSEGQGESTALHSVKVKLDLKNCKKIDAEVPHCSKKDGPSKVQALLQVALKDGLPLFTFAIDNKSDILAATLRKVSPEKDKYRWIYTFFVIHKMKKKSGSRINQVSKDGFHANMPNVVAQMRVTDALSKQNSRDNSTFQEFVLFDVETEQPYQQASDIQLNNELAAIVVKLQKQTTTHSYGNNNINGSSASSLTEPFQNVRYSSGTGKTEETRCCDGSEDQLSMTVILPGGHHGLSVKGEPSSLIRRWKSGGSCDCGGWDLGCRMPVFVNHAPRNLRSTSTEDPYMADRFDLHSQGQEQDQKPVFSLSPFKDGIFSVEFNSSIKILQAFSISISVLSCLKPAEYLDTSNSLGEKPSEEMTESETDGTKIGSRTPTEFPAKYVSFPPLSPVGRV